MSITIIMPYSIKRSSDVTEFDIQLFARDISRAIYKKIGSKLQEIPGNTVKTSEPIDFGNSLT